MSGSPNERARPASEPADGLTWPQYLWAHAGMISGGILGACFFGFIAFLALIGYRPAVALLLCFVGFFGLIALGGRFRGR